LTLRPFFWTAPMRRFAALTLNADGFWGMRSPTRALFVHVSCLFGRKIAFIRINHVFAFSVNVLSD
jgi:hypothetical protein